MKPTAKPFPRANGFTLVELLVVIAILAVLVAVSLSGYVKLRNAGDRATTISNLRQMQAANASYATDHNGRYVPLFVKDDSGANGQEWVNNRRFLALLTGDDAMLTKASSDLPHHFLDPVAVRAKGRLWNKLFASYGYNESSMPGGNDATREKGFRSNQISNPARSAAFVTGTDHYFKYSGRLIWENNPAEGKSQDGKLAFRHGGKAIVTYYDGSTALITPADISKIDSQGGSSHPFWKANQ